MKTFNQNPKKEALSGVGCEYTAVVISKSGAENVYGIAAQDTHENKLLCVREIGSDKELTLSIVDTLNSYRVPYVHFSDVVDDLMYE